MKTLTFARSPDGMVSPTVLVTPKQGDEFYLCNPMDEVIAAREESVTTREPFIAHMVVGMKPHRIIIEPGTLARMRELYTT